MIYGNITNCSVVGHGQISAYQCRMGYQVTSEDTNTNTRQVKLQLEARTIDSRYTTTGYKLTPVIDGTTLSAIGMNFGTSSVNKWQVLGARIITITGAFNGTKSGSFTTNMTAEWGLKSGSASVTINLDNLHTPPTINSVGMSEKNTLLENYVGIAQYLSVKNITFDTTTYDDATISSYQVHHNGALIGSSTSNGMTLNFGDVGTLATFEMEGKTWCALKFVVIDSYGTIGSSEMHFEVTKYTKPNLVQTSSNIKRNGQLTGKVKMNLTGSFYSSDVNDVANTIKLEFAYWKKGGEESTTYYEIPFEPTGDSINLYSWEVAINDVEIEDVDKDFAYIFKVKATDYFNQESPIELLCPVGEYLWAEFKDRVDFKKITIQGVDCFEYSKEEMRIGTWVDGKPLYRKVFNNITVAKNGNSSTPHGISNLGVIARYTAHSLYNGVYRGITYSTGSIYTLCEIDNSNINIYNTTANPYTITVIIEYTKATD